MTRHMLIVGFASNIATNLILGPVCIALSYRVAG